MRKIITLIVLIPSLMLANEISQDDINKLTQAINELTQAVKEHKKALENSALYNDTNTENDKWPHKDEVHWYKNK